jgi:hypothetical protein
VQDDEPVAVAQGADVRVSSCDRFELVAFRDDERAAPVTVERLEGVAFHFRSPSRVREALRVSKYARRQADVCTLQAQIK